MDQVPNLWRIPISISTEDTCFRDFPIFKTEKKNYQINLKKYKWIKLNGQQSSFFRVQYDQFLLNKLGKAVKELSLPSVDRLGLENDLFALSSSGKYFYSIKKKLFQEIYFFIGRTSTDFVLEFLLNYKRETDSSGTTFFNIYIYFSQTSIYFFQKLVWLDILKNLSNLLVVWSSEKCFPNFKSYLKQLLEEIQIDLGWNKKEGESSNVSVLRSNVLNILGKCGNYFLILIFF